MMCVLLSNEMLNSPTHQTIHSQIAQVGTEILVRFALSINQPFNLYLYFTITWIALKTREHVSPVSIFNVITSSVVASECDKHSTTANDTAYVLNKYFSYTFSEIYATYKNNISVNKLFHYYLTCLDGECFSYDLWILTELMLLLLQPNKLAHQKISVSFHSRNV